MRDVDDAAPLVTAEGRWAAASAGSLNVARAASASGLLMLCHSLFLGASRRLSPTESQLVKQLLHSGIVKVLGFTCRLLAIIHYPTALQERWESGRRPSKEVPYTRHLKGELGRRLDNNDKVGVTENLHPLLPGIHVAEPALPGISGLGCKGLCREEV